MQADPSLTVAQASAVVVEAFGLTNGTDLTTFDPIASNDISAQKAAASVATIISLASDSSADTTTIINNIVEEIQRVTTTSDTTDTISFTDSTILTNIVEGVTLDTKELSAVSDAVTAIDGASSLGEITAVQSEALDTTAVSASTLVAATITNDTTPSVCVNLNITSTDGTAAVAGDTVLLRVDGIQVDSYVLQASDITSGYAILTSTTLSEGSHSVTAAVIDQAGNMGEVYSPATVVVDTIAPSAPSVESVTADDIINLAEKNTGVTITGTTEAENTVTVAGQAATVTDTSWSYTLSSAQIAAMGEGAETLDIVATDAAGNTTTTSKSIYIDTVASTVTATITAAADDVGAAGNIASGEVTDDNTLGLSGTISSTIGAGDVLAIYDGSTRLGEATVSETNWTFTTAALTNAVHTFSARVEDAAGNNGTSSAEYTVTVNATLPTATVALDALLLTNDTTPALSGTITGTLDVTDTVKVYADGVLLGEATINGSTWSYEVLNPLSEGAHSFSAVVQNNAGNQGTMSVVSVVTVDTTVPTVVITTDDATLNMTDSATITLTFSEAPQIMPTVTASLGTLSTFVQDGSNPLVYIATLTPPKDTASENITFTVGTWTDAAGNNGVTTSSSVISVDTLAPTTLTIDNVATDDVINITEKTAGVNITGSADANALITLTLGEGNTHTVMANGLGAWSYTLTTADYSAIGDGAAISATATDAAGNVSEPITTTITVDTVAPLLTVNTMAVDDVVSLVEKTASVTLTGETEAGATVSVNGDTATVVGTSWSYTFDATAINTMGEGIEVLTVVAQDTNGNSTTRTKTITVDTIADINTDAAVSITPVTINNAAKGAVEYTVSGLDADATAVITFSDGINSVTANASTNGVATADLSTLTDGTITASIVITDTVGNIATGAADTAVLDTTADIAPAASLTIADTLVNNTEKTALSYTIANIDTDATAVITFTDGANTVTAALTGNGAGTVDLSSLNDGTITSFMEITDTAGNTETIIGDTTVLDTIAPEPGILSMINYSDTGSDDTPDITADNTFTLALSGNETGSSIFYQVSTDDGTTWSATTETQDALADSSYQFRAIVSDAAGNSSLTNMLSLTVNTIVPVATVAFYYAYDYTGSIRGLLDNNASTDDTAPRFDGSLSGSLGADEVVAIYDGSTYLGNASIMSSTNWNFTSSVLSEGVHSFTAVVENTANGLQGTPSAPFSLTIDTTPPAAADIDASTINDADEDGNYTQGDTIYITFDEPVAVITVDALSINGTNATLGSSTVTAQNPLNGYATTFAITLANDALIASDSTTITVANATDAAGNSATNVVFNIPSIEPNSTPWMMFQWDDSLNSEVLYITEGERV